MKLEVATDTGEVYTLEASQDLTLEDFKAAVGSQSGIPSQEISLSYRLQPLQDDKKTLIDLGLKDGELLLLERRASASSESARGIPDIDWSAIPAQSHDGIRPRARARSSVDQDDPEVVRQMFLSNPYQMALLRERNPELADAVTSGDVNRFTALLERQSRAVSDRNMEQIRLLNADHLDPNAQGRIAENIRLENVQVNLDTAIEHNPEAFGVVVMLYIECRVNGRLVKAFVDSGAQSTIMSIECAERCEIMRLVDRRFAGIARGVGMQRIVGRVHVAQVQIESAFMPCSFSIMQDQPMDMLLGLDMLKRHQCCIDLKNNLLHIGTTATTTPFLAESELPLAARGTVDPQTEEQLRSANESAVQNEEDRMLAEALSASTSGVSQQDVTLKEEDIRKAMDMGFARELVIQELRNHGGNVEQAIVSLVGKSFGNK